MRDGLLFSIPQRIREIEQEIDDKLWDDVNSDVSRLERELEELTQEIDKGALWGCNF